MDVANYHQKCADFLKDPSLLTAISLDNALKRVDACEVDIAGTENIFRKLRPLLTSDDSVAQLSSCRIILRYKLKNPSNQWVGAIMDQAASTFRDLSLRVTLIQENSDLITLVRENTQLWTEIALSNQLEEQFFYPLFTTATYWIFDPIAGSNPECVLISRKMVDFLAASYANLRDAASERILHQLISEWRKNPQSVSVMTDLILKIVATAGQIPMSQWEEAVSFRSRNHIEKAALIAHSKAKHVAQLISRRLVDMSWSKSANQRVELDSLIFECSKRCLQSQWASSEVFLSAFITTLFRLSQVVKSQKYPLFILEMLKTLYGSFAKLGAPNNEEERGEVKNEQPKLESLVFLFIKHNPSRSQALYLASRQMTESEQPFYDYYDALKKPSLVTDSQASNLHPQNWLRVLDQWPITKYHAQIASMLCDLALKKDLKDALQVDLFKILQRVVSSDPTRFDLQWLDRLNSAVPAVCETLIPIASHAYSFLQDEAILDRLTKRVNASGAQQYKKKVLNLVITQSKSLSLKWRLLLVAICDTDANVKSTALQLAQQWLQDNEPDKDLARALIEAEAADMGKYRFSVKQGLATLLENLGKAETVRIQQLVYQLVYQNELRLASVFISVDGRFTPMSSLKTLFAKSESLDPDSFYALEILNHALCARPRLILPNQLSQQVFSKFVLRLKTASEPELESITSVLGQLVDLGGNETQAMRKSALQRIFDSAVALAHANRVNENKAIFAQAVMIAGGARFWPVKDVDIANFAYQLIQWSKDPSQSLDTKLLFVRTVFGLVSHKEALFTDLKIDQYFSSLSSSSPEASCFTRQLLKLLWTPKQMTHDDDIKYVRAPTEPPVHSTSYLSSSSKSSVTSIGTISTLMLQKHFDRLVQVASEEEDVNALKVITKAMDDKLVVMDECIPLIISSCFSMDVAITQTALRSLASVCERWPRNLGPRMLDGFQQLSSDLVAARNIFPIIWQMLKEYSPRIQAIREILQHMAKLVDFPTQINLLKLMINGIVDVDMDTRDAKFLIQSIEDKVNMFDPTTHNDEETSKVCLTLIFSLWLRRRYDIRESPLKNSGQPTLIAALHRETGASDSNELEPLDCDALWLTLSENANSAAQYLEQLWRIQWYSAPKLDAILRKNCAEHAPKRKKIDVR